MRAQILLAIAAAGLFITGPARAGTPLGVLSAQVKLDAPATSVLSILGDVAQYPLIFKNVRRAQTLGTGADGQSSNWWVEVDLGWPLGTRWMRGTTRREGQQVEFHRTSGTLRRFDGILRVVPEGQRHCLAVYAAHFDLGPPRPPSWLGNLVENAVMPRLVADARRFVEASETRPGAEATAQGGSTSR